MTYKQMIDACRDEFLRGFYLIDIDDFIYIVKRVFESDDDWYCYSEDEEFVESIAHDLYKEFY